MLCHSLLRTACVGTKLCITLLIAVVMSSSLLAQSTATVSATLNPSQARSTAIPLDFEGISVPLGSVKVDANGNSVMTGQPGAFSAMLERIGVHSIRLGGTSAEESTSGYPAITDANNVQDFAQLIGANIIWTIPVGPHYDISAYPPFVQQMQNYHKSRSLTISATYEVGNEFEHYISYDTYKTRFDAYNTALRALTLPATTTGPSGAGSFSYSDDLSESATYAGSLHSSIGFITIHDYPGGLADHISSISQADTALIGPNVEAAYQSFYDSFTTAPLAHGFIPRIEETDSIAEGGYAGASDAYVAALWAVDWLCWNAYTTKLAGLNFHIAGTNPYNPIYPGGYATSYTLEPTGYGMFAFALEGTGYPLPVSLNNPSNVNMTAYALLETKNKNVTMHMVNRTYGSSAVDVTANINPGNGAGHAQIMYLMQTDSDITAKSGITIGGQPVNGDGSWSGGFTKVITGNKGVFAIPVPHAQVAIVHFF